MARPIKFCQIDGCNERVKGLGLCIVHYFRNRRGSEDITIAQKRGRKPKQR